MHQKGFAPILILVGVLILVGIVGGAYYLGSRKIITNIPTPVSISQTSPTPQATSSSAPVDETASWKTHISKYFSVS